MSQAVIRDIDESKRFECAVMFTDITAFTAMMREDEVKTIQKLESHQKQLEVLHRQYEGRVIQYYGDGSLSTFDSPLKAIQCAVAIQQNVRRLGLPLRIGIHLGEVVHKGAAVYGHGVNVASRIESVGISNSILFSRDVWKEIKGSGFEAESIGRLHFKHISKPIQVYALSLKGLAVPDKNHLRGKLSDQSNRKYQIRMIGLTTLFLIAIGILWYRNFTLSSLLDGEITTLGVMPFEIDGLLDMDDGFGEGLHENLVTKLSSFYGLQVLSSRATELYHSSPLNPRQVGRELGASHLLYGTCRPGQDDSVRVHFQLVDVRNAQNVWAYSLSKTPNDLFGDPESLVSDLAKFLNARENPFVETSDSISGDLSMHLYNQLSEAQEWSWSQVEADLEKGSAMLDDVLKKDSTVAMAHALQSKIHSRLYQLGLLSRDKALGKVQHHSWQALSNNRSMPEAFAALALQNYLFLESDVTECLELIQQAIQLRPSYDFGHFLMSWIHYDLQNYEQASYYIELARKLNPDVYDYGKLQAKIMEDSGKHRRAAKLYQKQITTFVEIPDAAIAYADYLAGRNALGEARSLLSTVPKNLASERLLQEFSIAHLSLDEWTTNMMALEKKYSTVDLGDLWLKFYLVKQPTEVWGLLNNAVDKKSYWLRGINHLVDKEIKSDHRFDLVLEEIGMQAADIQ